MLKYKDSNHSAVLVFHSVANTWGLLSLTKPQPLWIKVPVRTGDCCSYRKCPQDGSTFSCPPLVPGATRFLWKVGFLVCELEWNVPEKTPKGLSLTSFSLKAAHKRPVQTSPVWVHSMLLRVPMCLGGCPLRKEGWARTPQNQEKWRLHDYCPQLWEVLIPVSTLVLTADRRILKRVQRMATCQAVSTPPQFSSGNQDCSASRAGIASQVRKIGDNSHCFSSFCFTVLLMLRCSTVSSNVGFVVSAQLMDLGIMYLWDISIVFGAFLPMEGQAEILMNYLSHQVLVNDLS